MAELTDIVPHFRPHIERMALTKDEAEDTSHRYRWASGDAGRVDFLKNMGYEVVYTKDREGNKVPRMVDNSILMRCPREQWERRQGAREAFAKQLLEAPRKKVQSVGEQAGVEVTDHTREYRAPLEAAFQEKPDTMKKGEGVLSREDVQGITPPGEQQQGNWNPHLDK